MTSHPALSHRRRQDHLRAVLLRLAPRLGLTRAAVDRLTAEAWIVDLAAGRVLFAEGDAHAGTALVLGGVVQLQCDGDPGPPVTLDFVGSPDVFGIDWFQERTMPRPYTALGKTDALVAVFDRRLMQEVFADLPPENRPRLWSCTWRAAMRRLAAWARRRSLPVDEALVQACIDLTPRFGMPTGRGTMIDLILTRADLAALVGASEWTVRRAMPALERAGSLLTDGHRVVLSAPSRAPVAAPEQVEPLPTYAGTVSSRARVALRDLLQHGHADLGFTAQAAERFASGAEVVHVPTGSLLTPPGRERDVGLIVNADGMAWIDGRREASSRSFVVDVAWGRRWFRLPPITPRGMSWTGARAQMPCDVAFLPLPAFERIVSTLPIEWICRVAALTCQRAEQATCALSRSTPLRLVDRLLEALHDMARERSRRCDNGSIELTIPLHDAELGHVIGHRREGANRGLRELIARGLVQRVGTTIVLRPLADRRPAPDALLGGG